MIWYAIMAEDILKRLVDAACAVYRVGERLPTDDPLVRMLKEAALTTTASCVVFFYSPEVYNKAAAFLDRRSLGNESAGLHSSRSLDNKQKALSDLHTLCSYFFVAKKQEWIDARNFDVLIKEYMQIKEEIEEFFRQQATGESSSKSKPMKQRSEEATLSSRQKKIFVYAKDHPDTEISLRELRDLFPDVAYRTVQRDVQWLLEIGLIVKKGTTHNTTYHLSGH